MSDETERKAPIRLPLIVGSTGGGRIPEHLVPLSANPPIVTVWLVAETGETVLLSLSDTGFAALKRIIEVLAQGFDGPNMPEPFEPPRKQ
jgi:hypothetical protein